MSGREKAKVDGFNGYYDPNHGSRGHIGSYVYEIPCEMCGNMTKQINYSRGNVYMCPDCRNLLRKKRKLAEIQEYLQIITKEEKRFDKALLEIENQVKDLRRYERAIKIAKKAITKYSSIPEVMVAIELIKLGYSIIPQQKVTRYRVDFAIPKEKIVIEIDGGIFHKNKSVALDREIIIQAALGMDWIIIHIPAEAIRNNIRKMKVIIDKFTKLHRK